MGFIVYNTASGRAERYYKKEGIAKAQATKLNRCPYRSKDAAGEFRAIAYRDYEGVLMGVRGDALKYWSWLNTANRG
jgi:hypothetical protein